ncbi:Lysine-specific demethylase 4C [Hypsibius exemplaris]|uniref:Lysine-specific demethylase 4C n=1 Tax=Hypsibius exemplaris TaxID=2072580 RepID=A0A1W0X2Q1_HYPEX|nr:Lysine-specific demethylase 4C [Hypsibius exemplaris]
MAEVVTADADHAGVLAVAPVAEQPFNDPKNPKILTFHPTLEEFQDFEKYIHFMESRNAHLGGIAKVIPPRGWKARKGGYGDLDSKIIEAPISQSVKLSPHRGAYDVRNTERTGITVGELRRFAEENNMVYSFAEEMEEIERNFWKQLTMNPPLYGADSSGTLFDKDVTAWNVSDLPSALRTINEEYGIAIQGVNTPYLYFGMWRAFFGWHTEDMDLYSINYIHDGAAKFWYALAPQQGPRFERLAASLFPDSFKKCSAFLRHKSSMISHSVLKSSGIPFNRIMQHENEFIITFPHAYHAGFNCGLNVAESTNFATERWIDYGKYASICSCQEDNVKIDMGIFIKKYRPGEIAAWNDGTERGKHPEDERTAKRLPTSGPAFIMSKSIIRRKKPALVVSRKRIQPSSAAPRTILAQPHGDGFHQDRIANSHKRTFSESSESSVSSSIPSSVGTEREPVVPSVPKSFALNSNASSTPGHRLDLAMNRDAVTATQTTEVPLPILTEISGFCETVSERVCRGRRRRSPEVLTTPPKPKQHFSRPIERPWVAPPPPPERVQPSYDEPIDLRCHSVKIASQNPSTWLNSRVADISSPKNVLEKHSSPNSADSSVPRQSLSNGPSW